MAKPHLRIIEKEQSLRNSQGAAMADPIQTLRRSLHAFLKEYHYFSSFAALVGFPYAVSILLSQSFSAFPSSSSPSGFLKSVSGNLRNLFYSAGFPSSEFFVILNHKLSQTISSSIFSLPFTLTFLLISKAVVIQVLNRKTPNFSSSFSSIITLYSSLLPTHICNSFLIISANSTVFCLLFFAFNFFEGFTLFVSVAGAVLYSVVVANAFLICNFALILSGIERCGGYLAIIKACVLLRGRTSIALSLALPANLTLAAIEVLFQHRIIRPYRIEEKTGPSMVLEGIFIAYLYSIIIVLDTIITTMFVKSCIKSKPLSDLGGKCSCLINGEKEENESYRDLKIIHCLL